MVRHEPLLTRLSACLAAVVFSTTVQGGQRGSGGPWTAQTRPVSPSVLATIAVRNQNVELLVLWRGRPGWFFVGASRSASYSGGSGPFTATVSYGGIQLSVSYDPEKRIVMAGGLSVPLAEGQNVVLVDTVDQSPWKIAGVIGIKARVEGNPSVAALLAESPEIVSFLRCDAPMENAAMNRTVLALVCDDLPK
jgi:hypothetical protein